MIDSEPPPDPRGLDGAPWDDSVLPPVPDSVDLVVEVSTMMAVFAAQRLRRVDAMRGESLAEAVARGWGVRDLVERSIRLELAAAMRITEYAAGRLIVLAEAMVHRYPEALDALAGGRITEKHAEILVDLVEEVEPDLRSRVVKRALEIAQEEPVGSFRRALRALIESVRSVTLAERHAAALERRRVVVEPAEDGMAALWAFGPAVEMHAIFGRLTAMAKVITAAEDETRTLDQVRADILGDLLVDGTTDHIPAAASGIRASVVVTVPVLSLLDDQAAAEGDSATVEGVGPIPVSRARELCGGDAKWMRVLTHPETGMVLSVGREQYSPPAALRKLVKWRADRCMAPGCGMPASRCEVDHQVDWARGGQTSLTNLAPLCKGHHIVKHHGGWTVRQIDGAGGTIEWISPTGRSYLVRPERRVPAFTVTAAVRGADGDRWGGDGDPPF